MTRSRRGLALLAGLGMVIGPSVTVPALATDPGRAGTAAVSLDPGTAGTAGTDDNRPAGGRPHPPKGCTLTDQTFTAEASPANEHPLQTEFWQYGDTGAGWTGADSTYSVPLAGGGQAWLFSDTFLGPVNPDGSRPQSAPFLNNSIVVRDADGAMTTITGGSAEAPDGLIPATEDGAWHWFGDGELNRHGDLQVGVLRFERFGEGAWDWGWTGNQLATIDTDSWTVTDLSALPSQRGVQWASWYQRIDGYTYIYGVEDLGAEKNAHVARVKGSDLSKTGSWRFWDGTRWVKDEAASVPVLPHVANEYSVTRYRDGFLLVTQDTSEPFSTHIESYVACSPQGPFVPAARLYSTPETGATGSYGNPNVITYNAHEHAQWRSGDQIVISYNVNSMNPDDLYQDVTIYRPRFVSVTLESTDGS